MAMTPVLKWELFPKGEDHKLSQNKLLRAMEGFCQANQDILSASRQRYPLLYESGVIYKPEPPGSEEWCDIPTIIKAGWGDCEDLAAWCVAELREVFHVPARPFLRFRKKDGSYHYHALLILPCAWKTVWSLVADPATTDPLKDSKGLPFLRPKRRPVFEKSGGGFVFEDPSARLGMYAGRMNYAGAYKEILTKTADPMRSVIDKQPTLSVREASAMAPVDAAALKGMVARHHRRHRGHG